MKRLNDTVAARIAALRHQKNITQHAMAQALSICDSAYSRLEAGETEITLTKLSLIAEVLQEEVTILLGVAQSSTQHPEPNQYLIKAQYTNGSLQFSLDEAALKRFPRH